MSKVLEKKPNFLGGRPNYTIQGLASPHRSRNILIIIRFEPTGLAWTIHTIFNPGTTTLPADGDDLGENPHRWRAQNIFFI